MKTPRKTAARSWLRTAIVCAAGFLLPLSGWGQLIYQESFTGSTAAGWDFSQGNTSPGPRLTAAAVPTSADPEFGAPAIDNEGNGWLRLATTTGDQSNAVAFDTSFASQGAEITIGFDFAFWKPGGDPADGITAFLWDAAQPFSPGAFGGSLGYANRTGVDGLGGGYLGAGLDVYGNYSNPTEGRNGGTGFLPGQVAVRGPGDGQTGYEFLGGTASNSVDSLTDIFGSGFRMDFINSPTRPDQDAEDYRRFEMFLDANNNLTLRMQNGFTGDMTDLFTIAIPGDRPDQLRFGFAGSTGGLNQVYEIRNLEIRVDGGNNAFYWDNEAAGTGWDTALNWDQDAVPTDYGYIYFTDLFPDTKAPHTVNVDVSPIVNSLTFSGSTAYTLDGANPITFDTNNLGKSYINLNNSPTGNADHIIHNDLILANDLEVKQLNNRTFTLNGDIDTSGDGHTLTFASASGGQLRSTGDITGTGNVIASGFGTTVFETANTYTGTTAVTGGLLRIEHANALGATSAGTTVSSGATLGLAGSQTFAAEPLTLSGNGVGGLGALRNISGANTWTGNTTLAADSRIRVDTGTTLTHSGNISGGAHTLTLDPRGSGNLNISGQVSGTNLVMQGTGTATLSASNTYTGTTTVASGTLRIENAGALGTGASSLATGTTVQSGATLALNGNFTVNNEYLTLSGQGAAGQAALWNAGGNQTWNSQIFFDANTSIGSATSGNVLTLQQAVSGNGHNLTVRGAGTVDIGTSLNNIPQILVEAGTLRNTAAGQLNDNPRLTVSSGATLNLTAGNETIGSLAGGGNVALGTRTLTLGGDNTSTTFSGVLSGSGTVTKNGTGDFRLTGANTHTGTLAINSGSVTLGAANTVNSTMDLVLNGGKLVVDGFANAMDQFTLQASSTLDFLEKAGSHLTFNSMTRTDGTLTIDNWNGSFSGGGDTRLRVNASSLGGALLTNITFTGWGDAQLINVGGGVYEVVPSTTGFLEWNAGQGNGNWNDGRNWGQKGKGGFPDSAGAQALIANADGALNGRTITLNGANRTVGTLAIANTTGATFTIANNTLIFNNGTSTANLTITGNSTPTITSGISLSSNLNLSQNSSGIFTHSGATLATNGNSLTVGGAGTTRLNSQITGGGSLIKNNTGTLRLSGNNTFTGGTTLNNGIIEINHNNAFGTGNLTLNGGTLNVFNADRTLANNFTVNNSFNITGGNNRVLNFNGTGTLNSGQHGVNVAADTFANWFGAVGGVGGLSKTGAGGLYLYNSNNSFTGPITVDGGQLYGIALSTSNFTFGSTVAGQNLLGAGTQFTVNSGEGGAVLREGGNMTFTSNAVLTANGGEMYFLNYDTNTPPTAHDFQFNGTANVNDGIFYLGSSRDMTLGAGAALNLDGGVSYLDYGRNFATTGTSANPATINVTNDASLEIFTQNGEDSSFTLGQHDLLAVTGPDASAQVINYGDTQANATLNGTVNLSDGSTLTFTSTDVSLGGTAILNGGTEAAKGTLVIQDGDLTVNTAAALANAPNITFDTDGSHVIQGIVADSNLENIGVLQIKGGGDVLIDASINNIQANQILLTEGTLILGDDDQIANNTGMTFAGGTWDTDGYSEVLGTLTLTANSNIDLGDGASVIQFANSSSIAWDEDSVIYIDNWSGDRINGGGTDQLRISGAGLTDGQRAQVLFRNPAGQSPGLYEAIWIGDELVPVPEPGTLLGGAFLFLFILFRLWKRETGLKRRQDAIDQQR